MKNGEGESLAMTDQELDCIMKRVLIDSLKPENKMEKGDREHSFSPTSRYKRRMHTMLANPIRWMRLQECPWWMQVIRRIAVILLVCIVILGGIMAFSSNARAAFGRWVMGWCV